MDPNVLENDSIEFMLKLLSDLDKDHLYAKTIAFFLVNFDRDVLIELFSPKRALRTIYGELIYRKQTFFRSVASGCKKKMTANVGSISSEDGDEEFFK